MLPEANDVAMLCRLNDISTLHNITEVSIGYLLRDEIKLFLYTTTIIREVVCRYRFVDVDDADDHLFIYSDVYLNITHTDIDTVMREMRRTEEKELWLYDVSNTYLLRDTEVDRYGFATKPVDIYKNFWSVYLTVKFLLLIPSVILTSCLYVVLQYRFVAGGASRGYLTTHTI